MNLVIPKQVSLERRRRVWELRQTGMTYENISKDVGISHQSVAKILTRITKKYTERHLADVDRIKSEQVIQLEKVAQEAYESWEKSKFIEHSASGHAYYAADPRYLQIFLKAKEDIRKITGAYHAPKTDLTININSLSIDDKKKFFADLPLRDKLSLVDGLIEDVKAEESKSKEMELSKNVGTNR